MHTDPLFTLTDKAKRYLAAHPRHYAPLQPPAPVKRGDQPIAFIQGGRR